MKYSLASYKVAISANDQQIRDILGEAFVIGGQGSAVGQISVELDNDMWTTEPFATGAWVHNKNLAKTGKVNIQISQLSEDEIRLRNLFNIYYTNNLSEGVTLSITNNDETNPVEVASCTDCYLTKIPATIFADAAQNDEWIFTCGEIIFK